MRYSSNNTSSSRKSLYRSATTMAVLLFAIVTLGLTSVKADEEPCGLPELDPDGFYICNRENGTWCYAWKWCIPVMVQVGPDPAGPYFLTCLCRP